MRKIIVAFESRGFSEGAMQFISHMNNAGQVTVSGVFLPAPASAAFWGYAASPVPGMLIPLTEDVKTTELSKSVKKFKQYCTDHHLRHRVIKTGADFGLPELKQQSRYADLIVLSNKSFFEGGHSNKVSDYLKTSLHDAECPVVVVPEKYTAPKYNILAFDGTESSARAIKNFAYLFPEMSGNTTVAVTFGEKNRLRKEHEMMIRELVSVHFPDYSLLQPGSDSKEFFSNWTAANKPAIVVCGAFGRSILSVLFKESFIADLIKEEKLPVFISHR